jgi:dihydrofolate reductase
MTTVYSHMTMSLDGFIAHPDDTPGALFDWYGAGPVTVENPNPGIPDFQVDEGGATLLRDVMSRTGALVCGRRLYDIANGWGEQHPIGAPVVVVTHRPEPHTARTSFATDVASGIARARELAGDKDVSVASADIAAQALELGLLDVVSVSLVPVLLGAGIPYFARLSAQHLLEDPVVVPGTRATHLTYRVRRD